MTAAKRGVSASKKPSTAKMKPPAKRTVAKKPVARKPPAKRKRSSPDSVVSAVRRDLKDIGKRDSKLAKGTLAMSALSLATTLDDPENSATSKSMCAKALREAIDRLWELAPPERTKDGLDELTAQRQKRLEKKDRAPSRRAAAKN